MSLLAKTTSPPVTRFFGGGGLGLADDALVAGDLGGALALVDTARLRGGAPFLGEGEGTFLGGGGGAIVVSGILLVFG